MVLLNRPVFFYGAISLDGYLADANDQLDWLLTSDLNGVETFSEFDQQIDTLVMGRITYDWTLQATDNAPLYPNKEKFILTHQPKKVTPPKTHFVAQPVVDLITSLKAKSGKGIWIVGGGQIVTTLLAENLIDALWVQIVPVLLGSGKPLFPSGNYQQRFTVVDRTAMGELTELHLKRNV